MPSLKSEAKARSGEAASDFAAQASLSSQDAQRADRAGIRLLSQELSALGMDLHATLQEEPRFLLDPQLLGALHHELFAQLDAQDARAALTQMGFLHGLRDARRVVQKGFGPTNQFAALESPLSARLPLRLARPKTGQAGGGFSVAGSWPERREAEAVIATMGAQAEPCCAVSAGFTSGWLSGIFEADILAIEVSCLAKGDDECSFLALDSSQWAHRAEPPAAALLALPFGPLRDVVTRHLEEAAPAEAEYANEFESGTPVIHVWGPVMVIPFSGPEESLRALELIGRDPGARDVRVVVLDLSGAIIDDGFGAAALEQILDAVEGWGAEPILTGVSPLSETVVADLTASHLVVSKDLPEAIALAFQVAELQRRGN